MDPTLAHANLAPPRQRVVARGLLPALVAHALLGTALAGALNWKRAPDPARVVSVPGLTLAADTAPTAELPQPALSTAVAPEQTRPEVAPLRSRAESQAVAGSGAARAPATASAAAPPLTPAPDVDPPSQRTAMGAGPAVPANRASFDCARARSPAERTICGDAQLSRLDRDLGRLYARAKAAAPDAAAFRRENEVEWKLREASCHDRDCLLAWYAHRRGQLEEQLAGAGRSDAR